MSADVASYVYSRRYGLGIHGMPDAIVGGMRTIAGFLGALFLTGCLAAAALTAGVVLAATARDESRTDAPSAGAGDPRLDACRQAVRQARAGVEAACGRWRDDLSRASGDPRAVRFYESALAAGRRADVELRRASAALEAAAAEVNAAAQRWTFDASLERSEAGFEEALRRLEEAEQEAEALRRSVGGADDRE